MVVVVVVVVVVVAAAVVVAVAIVVAGVVLDADSKTRLAGLLSSTCVVCARGTKR